MTRTNDTHGFCDGVARHVLCHIPERAETLGWLGFGTRRWGRPVPSWTISGPYWGFVAATFLDFVAYLMLGYRGLVRKEKFSVGAWYLWSVFGTLAVDAAPRQPA